MREGSSARRHLPRRLAGRRTDATLAMRQTEKKKKKALLRAQVDKTSEHDCARPTRTAGHLAACLLLGASQTAVVLLEALRRPKLRHREQASKARDMHLAKLHSVVAQALTTVAARE